MERVFSSRSNSAAHQLSSDPQHASSGYQQRSMEPRSSLQYPPLLPRPPDTTSPTAPSHFAQPVQQQHHQQQQLTASQLGPSSALDHHVQSIPSSSASAIPDWSVHSSAQGARSFAPPGAFLNRVNATPAQMTQIIKAQEQQQTLAQPLRQMPSANFAQRRRDSVPQADVSTVHHPTPHPADIYQLRQTDMHQNSAPVRGPPYSPPASYTMPPDQHRSRSIYAQQVQPSVASTGQPSSNPLPPRATSSTSHNLVLDDSLSFVLGLKEEHGTLLQKVYDFLNVKDNHFKSRIRWFEDQLLKQAREIAVVKQKNEAQERRIDELNVCMAGQRTVVQARDTAIADLMAQLEQRRAKSPPPEIDGDLVTASLVAATAMHERDDAMKERSAAMEALATLQAQHKMLEEQHKALKNQHDEFTDQFRSVAQELIELRGFRASMLRAFSEPQSIPGEAGPSKPSSRSQNSAGAPKETVFFTVPAAQSEQTVTNAECGSNFGCEVVQHERVSDPDEPMASPSSPALTVAVDPREPSVPCPEIPSDRNQSSEGESPLATRPVLPSAEPPSWTTLPQVEECAAPSVKEEEVDQDHLAEDLATKVSLEGPTPGQNPASATVATQQDSVQVDAQLALPPRPVLGLALPTPQPSPTSPTSRHDGQLVTTPTTYKRKRTLSTSSEDIPLSTSAPSVLALPASSSTHAERPPKARRSDHELPTAPKTQFHSSLALPVKKVTQPEAARAKAKPTTGDAEDCKATILPEKARNPEQVANPKLQKKRLDKLFERQMDDSYRCISCRQGSSKWAGPSKWPGSLAKRDGFAILAKHASHVHPKEWTKLSQMPEAELRQTTLTALTASCSNSNKH